MVVGGTSAIKGSGAEKARVKLNTSTATTPAPAIRNQVRRPSGGVPQVPQLLPGDRFEHFSIGLFGISHPAVWRSGCSQFKD